MKILATIFFLLVCQVSSAFYYIRFDGSDTGDDRYSDGTPLLEGECYAIVWQRKTVPFMGFAMDGTPIDPENCRVLEVMPIASRVTTSEGVFAYCPDTMRQIQNWNLDRSGVYSVYVFDTRIWTDGVPHVGFDFENWQIETLNAYSVVDSLEDLKITPGTMDEPLPQQADIKDPPTRTSVLTPLPKDVPTPSIQSVTIENGVVRLSLTNLLSSLSYNVSFATNIPSCLTKTNFVGRRSQGASSLVMKVPVDSPTGFFRVIICR